MAQRRSMLALAATAAAIACAVAAPAAPAQVTERLPDLVSDAPANPLLQTFSQPDGNHLLLRFDGYVHNQGQGAFEMRGSNRVGTEYSTVVQRVYRSDGSFFDDSSRDPHMIYEPEDGHVHWHLKDAARYSLWNEAKTGEVAPAMKTGFCLIDSQRRETHGPSSPVYSTGGSNNFCGQNEPNRVSLFEGVSAGWRDIYPRTLAFQWVDVSDVSPGRYWLRAEVDPDDWARESNEVNAAATQSSLFTIPGYAANPVDAGTISAAGPTTIPPVHHVIRLGPRIASVPDHRAAPARHPERPERPDLHEQFRGLHAGPGLGWAGPLHLYGAPHLEQLSAVPDARRRDAQRGRDVPERLDLRSPGDDVHRHEHAAPADRAGGRPIRDVYRERCIRRHARDGRRRHLWLLSGAVNPAPRRLRHDPRHERVRCLR